MRKVAVGSALQASESLEIHRYVKLQYKPRAMNLTEGPFQVLWLLAMRIMRRSEPKGHPMS